jgi:hypothetical protein
MTNFRSLIEEMADWIDDETRIGQSKKYLVDLDEHPLVVRARAALAEQPVGPTDEELLELTDYGISAESIGPLVQTILARWGQP